MRVKDRIRSAPASEVPSRPQTAVWATLAGVRFALASIVLIAHITTNNGTPDWAMSITTLGGFGAVIGFLIISGYSIAASLDRDPVGFYRRRFWRIAPVYLVCWAIAQLPWILYGPFFRTQFQTFEAPPTVLPLILNALCLQTWFTHSVITFNPSWSLAVEVFFYALAPFLFRLPTRALVSMIVISMVAYGVHCLYGSVNFFSELYGIAPLCLAWSWIGGFLFYRHRQSDIAKALLVLASVILVPQNSLSTTTNTTVTMVIVSVILTTSHLFRLSPLVTRVLNWLGDVSYPLYMVHFVVLCLAAKANLGAAPALALSFLAAVVLYYAVDLPARKYAKWREGKHASALPSPQRAAA